MIDYIFDGFINFYIIFIIFYIIQLSDLNYNCDYKKKFYTN